ncbi:DEAD H helicase [Pisolithus orientalis]|uniref:DEAD H helicase n=1 Tax=Pisolithus orientalis TaxID=936130 RepID=UPI0022240992|nr:DEAD H helicase [Pisolithus orientalis]KAI6019639.1 DEAD H helicase [Pisolithus orientalis]
MKRRVNEDRTDAEKSATKKQRNFKAKGKEKEQDLFKALNVVLAFVSSRKHLATTFPMVRSSVEGILKRPLELAQVAELKALLPDLINFAYIACDQLRIQAESSSQVQCRGRKSPDFSLHSLEKSGSQLPWIEEGEHVLVLEFADNFRGKKQRTGYGITLQRSAHDSPAQSSLLSLPPAMSTTQSKKLIESRDERFKLAVNELLSTVPDGEDPVEVPSPDNRPSVGEVIQEIQEQDWYTKQIMDRRTFPARTAREGFLSQPLSPSIQQALRDSRKITSFYTHQTAAINAICDKKHVIVSTSTASGKSVIYQVPILRFLEEDPSATAMFVYPTKALAQDQRTALEQLLWSCPELRHVNVATYDGDTPQERRAAIREGASIIFTNFDTIHASILPHEELWRRLCSSFLQNLKILAVDELHYYSDLMGSHVAQVIRRFRRVCAAVGNRETVFVSCSATITKPAQHMQRLFGVKEVEEITDDGAPSGCKDYLVWVPPYVDERAPKLGHHSAMSEATRLMRFLMKRGIRVILFCKAMKALRTDLSAEGRLDILAKVMPYRGGERIEHEAFSGNLLGIVATNALELGIDIGVLDAVIMLGFPFGLANFRQQAGRAGRRARDSMAVLVADMSPLDQQYVKNPDALYNNPIDDLVIHLDSKEIVEAHIQCAAHELPVSKDDVVFFGPLLSEICDKKLIRDEDGWYHTHPKYLPYPQKHVAIRGAEEVKYIVVDVTKVQEGGQSAKILEELELSRALFEVYEGGVFMHQGLAFIVKEVSHDAGMAQVLRADVNWITSPRDIDAKQTYRIKEIPDSPHRLFFGRVEIVTVVYGLNKCILDVVDVDTPPWERQGTGLWLDVPGNILDLLRSKAISPAAAIHSACHAWMNGFALGACLKTECKAAEKELKAAESRRKRPARLIFYESLGNSGITAQAFDHASEILKKAQSAVETCPCEEGCANCILSPTCREHNTISSKIGALVILRGLLNLEIDVDSIPRQENELDGADTIVKADFVRPIDGVEVEAA